MASGEGLKFGKLAAEEYTKGWKVRSVHEELPSVMRPASSAEASLEALKQLVVANRDQIRARIKSHGAVLFRGFSVKKPQDFEDVALLVEPNLSKEYLGTSPRKNVTEYTFTASELPAHFPIPQHIEMSFLPSQPAKLMFCCLQPSLTGGETPLVNFAQVCKDLPETLRNKFERLGIKYVRNYTSPDSKVNLDPWKLKKWPEIFETTDRKKVEAVCAREEVTPMWLPGGGLRLDNKRPAIVQHPDAKIGKVWSNHLAVFHPSQASQEYRRIANLSGVWWHWFLFLILAVVYFFRRLLQKEEDQGMNALFGDGTPITSSEAEQVREAIWNNLVLYPWKAGDVIFIDNSWIGHGRLPYSGPRYVIVAWGN